MFENKKKKKEEEEEARREERPERHGGRSTHVGTTSAPRLEVADQLSAAWGGVRDRAGMCGLSPAIPRSFPARTRGGGGQAFPSLVAHMPQPMPGLLCGNNHPRSPKLPPAAPMAEDFRDIPEVKDREHNPAPTSFEPAAFDSSAAASSRCLSQGGCALHTSEAACC